MKTARIVDAALLPKIAIRITPNVPPTTAPIELIKASFEFAWISSSSRGTTAGTRAVLETP